MPAKAILVAAANSGAGKTTLTAGLLAAFRRRGLRVAGAKTGPDYIDPSFHRAAAGGPVFNLDSWAMPPPLLGSLLAEAAADADLIVVEGAMGLFDGLGGPPGARGAAADIAARFGLPVLLVLDVAGQSQTAAAVAHGLATYDPGVAIAGVVLNRVAGDRHRDAIAAALAAGGIRVFGALPRGAVPALPSRHLGLVQAGELTDTGATVSALADAVERHLDLDAILAAAAPPALAAGQRPLALLPPGQRIALATDAAFSFIYDHVVAGWLTAGAEIAVFSPLNDEAPPEGCDCCWLPGGYPELHAATLAAAGNFLSGLRRFAATRPVHGECGGFMVLGQAIEDADGQRHPMAGLLGHATSFRTRRLTLGYRIARPLPGAPPALGREIRGHEFHYSTMLDAGGDAPLVDLFDGLGRRLGQSGARRGNVTGTYFHAIATV